MIKRIVQKLSEKMEADMPEVGGAWEPGEESINASMDNVNAKLKNHGKHGGVISGCVA